jgi:hypothetical protein
VRRSPLRKIRLVLVIGAMAAVGCQRAAPLPAPAREPLAWTPTERRRLASGTR